MDPESAVAFASAIGQLGIGAVALKAVLELKKAVQALTDKFDNHEQRITKLEKD